MCFYLCRFRLLKFPQMDVSDYHFFFRRKQLFDNIFTECGSRLNQKSILCIVSWNL